MQLMGEVGFFGHQSQITDRTLSLSMYVKEWQEVENTLNRKNNDYISNINNSLLELKLI